MRHVRNFALATVAIDALGIGIMLPVLPDLLQAVGTGSLATSALAAGALGFAYGLLQFACSPLLGSVSDRLGRRPVLLVALAALTLDYVVMVFASTFWLLLAGRAMAGAAAATQATASACMADITPPDRRAHAFGLVGAAMGAGFVLGPLLGGLLAEFGVRAPFAAAAGLTALNLAYGAVAFREPLAPERRRPFDWRRANPIGALDSIVRRPGLGWLACAVFLLALATTVYPAVWSFYTREVFGWTPAAAGVSFAVFGVGFAVVQGGVVGRVIPRYGEVRVALAGAALSASGLVAYAVVTEGWMLYAVMPVALLGSIAMPAVGALLSNAVGSDAQGELQGVNASLFSLAAMLGPVLMTQLFGHFAGEAAALRFPGAPFVAAALLCLLAGVATWRAQAVPSAEA